MKINPTVTALKAGAAALAVSVALVSTPSFAQDAAPAAADTSANDADAIVVTGSRIARPELTASIPVAVVSSQSIENKGQTNALDAIRDIPIAGQSLDKSASNFSNFDNGISTVNLRNLGTSRTLVLINGRRSVGTPGDSAVDLNNIAPDLIDHIEIATGGTSAVYGSDAVAGVVNIILKKRFDGVQLHLQGGISSRGDAGNQLASITAGKTFADDRGHVIANFTYTHDEALFARDRAYSAVDVPNKSSYASQGLFDTGGAPVFSPAAGTTFTFSPANAVKPYEGAGVDGYNRNADRLLGTPVQRYLGSVLADYEFSPAATLFAEFTYSKTRARSIIEPLAVDDLGTQGQSVYNFDGSPFSGIPATNPLVPAAIRNAAIANGSNVIYFRRRSNGLFERNATSKREYYRGVLGLRGDIGSNWKYEAYYEHSRVKDHTFSQAILMNNYGAALQATTINGQVVCADPVARAAGCVPINIFGFNTATPAMVKWLSTYTGKGALVPGASPGDMAVNDLERTGTQDVAALNLTGSLFELPAGAVQIAVGAEYHREKSVQIYDPFTQSGWSSAQQAANTIGQYNSKEVYGEVNVPLLRDVPFGHELTLEGAVRYADYSTVGSFWSYKFGGTYAPVPDLRFRAIYARAVRAPNVNELYSGLANTAPAVVDPCDQNEGNGDDPRPGGLLPLPAACAAIPGIANYLRTHPGQPFTYTLAQIQTINGAIGGNTSLDAESTQTLTAGATFTPTFFRGFDLSVDYYRVKVKNAITQVDFQVSADQCVATGDPNFCNNVTRDPNTGIIKSVDAIYLNGASYEVEGIDTQAHYTFRPHVFGPDERVDLSVFWNHKFKQDKTPFAGGAVGHQLGVADVYGTSQNIGTGFKDQVTFNAALQHGPFGLAYTFRYFSPVVTSTAGDRIPSYTYHDIQAKFTVGEDRNYEFYVGVNNLFDKQPPIVTDLANQWPGTNTVASTYDLVGRRFYAGARAKF
jgi:outer membrane receptor protein involved in Fe transport